MIIYLNGTSSSGKTSIAKELKTILKEPYFYFSIDTLLYSLCNEDLEAIMGKLPYRQKLDWDAIFEGYLSFDVQIDSDKSTPYELASLISNLVPSGPSAL